MDSKRFEDVINKRIEKCKEILLAKSDEYATDDRLHNFKVAAKIENCLPVTALAGMMAKHTVSVYDLIQKVENKTIISREMWDEKIGDHINYLLLLDALVKDSKTDVSNEIS